jgi:Zn-dependent alcohol dehydrogenase
MEIKAAVLYGPGEELWVETVQLADPKSGDVLVRIVGSGVCGSDVHLLQAFEATRPGGTVVVGVPSPVDATITLPARIGKTVMRGGPGGTQWANTTLLVDLYMAGKLKLDELISRQRPLDEVNEAFADLRAGHVARTVLLPTG